MNGLHEADRDVERDMNAQDGTIYDAADAAHPMIDMHHQELNFDDYATQALVTEKTKTELRGDVHFVRELMRLFASVGAAADLLKKQVIYGREITAEQFQGALRRIIHDAMYAKGITLAGEMVDEALPVNARLMHATLGTIGEAGEMFEQLLLQINGAGLDIANVIEEAGDGLWYQALALDEVQMLSGQSPAAVADINIRKLAERAKRNAIGNPDSRDLEAERRIIEGASA